MSAQDSKRSLALKTKFPIQRYSKDLTRTNCVSIQAMLMRQQLRWTSHVCRMEDYQLPKCMLYGELSIGSRCRGGQRKRFEDQLKKTLVHCNLDVDTWETVLHLTAQPGAVRQNLGCKSLNSVASVKLRPNDNVSKKPHRWISMDHLLAYLSYLWSSLLLSAISLYPQILTEFCYPWQCYPGQNLYQHTFLVSNTNIFSTSFSVRSQHSLFATRS